MKWLFYSLNQCGSPVYLQAHSPVYKCTQYELDLHVHVQFQHFKKLINFKKINKQLLYMFNPSFLPDSAQPMRVTSSSVLEPTLEWDSDDLESLEPVNVTKRISAWNERIRKESEEADSMTPSLSPVHNELLRSGSPYSPRQLLSSHGRNSPRQSPFTSPQMGRKALRNDCNGVGHNLPKLSPKPQRRAPVGYLSKTASPPASRKTYQSSKFENQKSPLTEIAQNFLVTNGLGGYPRQYYNLKNDINSGDDPADDADDELSGYHTNSLKKKRAQQFRKNSTGSGDSNQSPMNLTSLDKPGHGRLIRERSSERAPVKFFINFSDDDLKKTLATSFNNSHRYIFNV